MMKSLRDPTYSIMILAVTAILFIADFFVPFPALSYFVKQLGNWAIIFAAFAMAYGLLRVITRNVTKVMKPGGMNIYSIWILVIMLATFVTGVLGGSDSIIYKWIYQNIYSSLGATLMSFSFLYTVSAAVRVLRIKSTHTIVFSISCILCMLADIPSIGLVSPIFVPIQEWILGVASRGVYVAMYMSIALGMVLMGLRTMTGLERGWIGIREEDQ